MDGFLNCLEDSLIAKNKNDILISKYLNDINNNLLLPLLIHFDMCEELVAFEELSKLPFDKDYNHTFKELVNKICLGK